MPSKVDIGNDALRLLGASRITAFDDGSKGGNILSDIYDDVRQEMLQFPWNFAASRAELARLVAAPTFEFKYAYALPSDWLYTVSAHNNDAAVGTMVYKEEIQDGQNVILADSENVYIKYSLDLTDPNRMSAKFRRALAATLAQNMAIAITNSNTVEDQMEARAKKLLNKAKSSDALQSTPNKRPIGSWARIRSGSIRGNFDITGN